MPLLLLGLLPALALTALVAGSCEGGASSPTAPSADVSGSDEHRAAAGASGVWIGREELRQRPASGPSWNALLAAARNPCGPPRLEDQNDSTNVCVLAKAIASVRLDDDALRREVVEALRALSVSGVAGGGATALSVGRELAAYVVAADLIGLATADPQVDAAFRSALQSLLTAHLAGGPDTLVECHEVRPNNWGTHCGASRAAVASYLGNEAELAKTAQVFRGWLGDRSAYAAFVFGDLSWQCNPGAPVGVNPRGCTREGHLLDGVLPDDQRRAGPFRWPPPHENYAYEALQGALVQAVILQRAGYDAFGWEDRALLRAYQWLHEQAHFPAEGDDTWQMHVVNFYYGSSFPAPRATRPGKNMGWTDFTHAR